MGHELREGADLAVCTETFRAFDDANGAVGEFCLELMDGRDGWLIGRGDAEEKFEFAGEVLAAMGAKGFEHPRVETFERFENRDARGEWRQRRASCGEEGARCDDRHQVVGHSRDGQDRGERFHSEGD